MSNDDKNGIDLFIDQIYLGNCIELLKKLPDQSIDLIVSSPPYNIGKEYEAKRAIEIYLDEQKEVLRECSRVLKDTGSIFWQVGSFSNSGILIPLDIKFFPILESFGLIPRNRIVWVRQHGLHAQNKFSCRHETILWFTKSDNYVFSLDEIRVPQKYQNKKHYKGEKKGQLSCNPEGKNPGDIWVFRNVKHNHEEQTIHPCQFPEDMIARIILATTKKGSVILDPYMGTGTVATAAIDLERHYIGAELDSSYHKVALRRIKCEPDENNSFPNLKTLRRYVEKTGQSIEKFNFDKQIGKKATDSSKSKIYPEEYHLEEIENRLLFEEDIFSSALRGLNTPNSDSKKINKDNISSKSTNSELTLPLFENLGK